MLNPHVSALCKMKNHNFQKYYALKFHDADIAVMEKINDRKGNANVIALFK